MAGFQEHWPLRRVIRHLNQSVAPTENVLSYGADPTGGTVSTTAIRDAIAAAEERQVSGNSGVYGTQSTTSGSCPIIYFPAGVYDIDGPLTSAATGNGLDYIHFLGDNAILTNSAENTSCFTDIAWDARFTGLKFRGFSTQVALDTNNVNRAKIDFVDCEFTDPDSRCISMSSDTASAIVNIERCRFSVDQADVVAIETYSDFCNISGCWFQTDCTTTIINRNHLNLKDCIMVPSGTNTDARHWIANYGNRLYVEKMRFGGEGAGRAFLWHYTDTDAAGTINPVHVIIKDMEAYAVEELMRLYGLPNHLVLKNVMDDTPVTSASPVIWADTAITDQELEDWARYGSVDIDERWPRTRVTGNTEVAAMLQIKNLKTNPRPLLTQRVPTASVVGSGDHASGWTLTSTTANSAGNNGYGTTSQVCTANSADDSVWLYDNNFLPESVLGRQIYTLCHEIEWQPNSDAGHGELLVDAGGERYTINLLQGRHVYSFPFLYLNGGSGVADTNLDNIQYQTGGRMANGDVITFHRWYLLEGLQPCNHIALQMSGTAAPSALSTSVGPNQSFFLGDIVWETAPASGTDVGRVNTTAGNPGSWASF